jgi:membrane protease YdiL (CAAX protease family)
MQPETGHPDLIQPAPASPLPASRIWGGWATVGLGAAIFAIYFVAQNLVGLAFIVNILLTNRGGNLIQLITDLQTNGFMVSIATFVSVIAGMGFIILFIKLRKGIKVSEYLGLKSLSLKAYLTLPVVIIVLLGIFFGLDQIIKNPQSTDFAVNMYKTIVWPPALWIATVIFAPAFEESFFRGFLFVGLKQSRVGPAGAIALTSIIFASLHAFQYDVYGVVTVLVLGIAFGLVRLVTGSLWSTLILHSVWNLISMVQTVLVVNGIGS